MYSIRVPFEVINGAPDIDAESLELGVVGDTRVWLQAVASLRDSQRLSLRASGFPTELAARQQAEHLVTALRLTFLRSGLLADFLNRTSFDSLSHEGLRAAGGHLPPDRHVINEAAGVLVYPTGHQILAYRGSAAAAVHVPPASIVEQFHLALGEAVSTPRAIVAHDLYSGHTRMPTPDASLLTLVSAAEALVDPEPVPAAHLALIDRLVAEVSRSDLQPSERAAFSDRVRTLRTESIRRASRRMSRTLRPRTYNGEPPDDFFDRVYELRSRLIHGDDPPSRLQVSQALTPLSLFVRDLIEAEFVAPHPVPDPRKVTTRVHRLANDNSHFPP